MVRCGPGGAGMRRSMSSSAMLLSVMVMTLGAVMLKLSGTSRFAMLLSVLVLCMGLGASVVMLLRSGFAPQDDSDGASALQRERGPGAAKEKPTGAIAGSSPVRMAPAPSGGSRQLRILTQLLDSFDDWWNSGVQQEPWPAFDRWLR